MTSMTDADRAAFEAYFTEAGKDAPPRYLGTRFDAAGKFLPERGNTVVRQVVPGSATEAALVKVREALMALPYGDRFAWTPVESYHMTVFEGVMEDRRQPGLWPDKVSYEATIDDTTELFIQRLKDRMTVPSFNMTVERVTPLGLTLTGATPKDEQTARQVRNLLTGPFGYRSPTHDSYRFHTTLAYIKDWLPAGAAAVYLPELARLTQEFAAEIKVLDLAPPALCTFEDMNWFEPVLFL